jgi:hypothetical protein
MPSQEGSFIEGWSSYARAVLGFGPVAEVPFNGFFLLGLHDGIVGDGGESAEEKMGSVGHGGADSSRRRIQHPNPSRKS